MNSKNDQSTGSNSQCCIDYCKTSFKTADNEIVNVYKCNQQSFSTSDMWNIQRKKKQFEVNGGIGMM